MSSNSVEFRIETPCGSGVHAKNREENKRIREENLNLNSTQVVNTMRAISLNLHP